ncbi:7252_t:CDS:2 [Acaulospora colombiana]|uniref:7252_t:CDS:1 n=1 Tax=Acaulospora colombiana TaxID=27376 RepID=A0ACA9LQ07_9GLOM|nr:7252_t:CDS:2 [Acaulospora colombiana]
MNKISSKLKPNKSTHPSPQNGPEIVVFDEAQQKAQNSSFDIRERKSFMSSKISKLKDKPASKPPKDDEEAREEELNRKNDKELEELLKTTKILELYAAEHLTGKQRRKYNDSKIVDLGAKIPTPISLGMQAKRQEREKKELEEAKNLGLYHRSIKHKWAASSSAKQKSRSKRDRGIRMGIGKIKGGMLTLSSNDVKRVQSSGKIKKRRKGGIKKITGKF